MSGIYNHPNASGGSQSSGYSAYRYGDEPPQPIAPPHRTSSRSTAAGPASSSMLPLEGSRGPTDYLLASGALPPPRRSSRRISPNPSLPTTPGSIASNVYLEDRPPHSSEEWMERGAAVSTRRETDSDGRTFTKVMKKGVKDFEFGRTLGEGSYSTVLAATDRTTLKEYAIKVLDKRHIIKEKKVKYVNIEKDTLKRLNDHPGIVRLYYTFQDENSLYFVLDLAKYGELLTWLKKIGTFSEQCTRFYGAQILDTIDYMHSRGVLHRDLKPENVLLDADMHVKITDFGTAKILEETRRANGAHILPGNDVSEHNRSVSFVGTAEYVSPELLTAKEGGKPTDLWAFGCIIYQLLTGRPPFKGVTEWLTFEKIMKLDYTFPAGFPPLARDLVERLLVSDPAKRLSIEHVKNHEFFAGIQWGRGLWKQPAPRLKPYEPGADPIRLNGAASARAPNIMSQPSAPPRPQTSRLITDIPPPSQLDIDWSPVLTRANERILKLGNLIVTVSPQQGQGGASVKNANGSGEPSTSFPEPSRKLSRFFMHANTTKRRQRLVMVTSSARIILAASGGDEKKAKLDLSLLTAGVVWRSWRDPKGLTLWCVDTVGFQCCIFDPKLICLKKDKHIVFEQPSSPLPEPDGTAILAREWMDTFSSAREIAFAQHTISGVNSYSGDSNFDVSGASQLSSPDGVGSSGSMGLEYDGQADGVDVLNGHHHQGSRFRDGDEPRSDARELTDGKNKGRKRFSRRQSKGGLAAVF
jgi:3-phosphoinositide dependent protein kinase-1